MPLQFIFELHWVILAVSTTQNYANLISSSKSNDESKFDPATIGKMKEISEWKTLVKVYKMGYLFLHLKWAILGITSGPQSGPKSSDKDSSCDANPKMAHLGAHSLFSRWPISNEEINSPSYKP